VRVERSDGRAVPVQKGAHHLPALGNGEVARLGIDDLDARIVAQDLAKAPVAVVGRRRTNRADELDESGLTACQICHHPARVAALLQEVRAHVGHVEVIGHIRAPVDQDDGDARSLGLLEDLPPPRLDDRRDADNIHLLGDK